MLRTMTDMPVGTIGFDDVEDDDCEQTVAAAAAPRDRRGTQRAGALPHPQSGPVESDAMTADTGFRVRHATSYERPFRARRSFIAGVGSFCTSVNATS